MSRDRLGAAIEELAAARALVGSGFSRQAVSRAYYAAFYAAESVLLEFGESRSKHTGVIAAFGRYANEDAGFGQGLASLLRSLFRVRGLADYDPVDVSMEDALHAIRDAEQFVEVVQAWFAERP